MYSAATKVVHVNEIANVPSTLVAQAQHEGKAWSLQRIPAGKGHPLRVISSRLQDLFHWLRKRRGADLIHLHYAANGYYGWGKLPFVLHLHGSDIRKDWQKPGLKQVISKSLRRADKVLCATPDLLPWVQKVRPDAVWVPNPLPLEFFIPIDTPVVSGRVVFSSRWDDTKGLDVLLPLAQELVDAGVEVHGLDWGDQAFRAAELGVVLHPLMPLPEFARFLASADLVVGQLQFAALSMTDYQTLALGRRLLCSQSVEAVPAATVAASDSNFPEGAAQPTLLEHVSPLPATLPRDPKAIAKWIISQLAEVDSPAAMQARRDWVYENHHPANVVARLEEIYREIV
ncbi:glycosyltransferase [Gleimia sp. 6138-11-ORH1]|uniref:glycosyltransferase n=1 Tax=Gleimia sp. 6138-11-ORH1 TaxID=2973937 RepID=UPI002168F44E|nr:glycosyltransferase [Gleimia sp. 6138-11-ORH1]MCS4484028.1 glycosyltransferase [Gleimia sp. 6138-11-ORH1]